MLTGGQTRVVVTSDLISCHEEGSNCSGTFPEGIVLFFSDQIFPGFVFYRELLSLPRPNTNGIAAI